MRVRTEAKRDAIIEAASGVFLEAGFEGASMAKIAAQVGGSKATLYGYFGTKEELFLEVAHLAAKRHLEPIFAELQKENDDLAQALQRFGERTLAALCDKTAIQARRAVIAISGRSDIGKRYHEIGPKVGMQELARFLEGQMSLGRLRQSEPLTTAHHLTALLDSETITPLLFGIESGMTKAQIRSAVRRAIETFMRGFGP